MSFLAAAVVALARGGGTIGTIGPPSVQEALGEIASGIWPGNHITQLQFLPLAVGSDGCPADSNYRILFSVVLENAEVSNLVYVFNDALTGFEFGISSDGSRFSFDSDSTSACNCTETECGTTKKGEVADGGRTITGLQYYAFRYADIWLDDISPLESIITDGLTDFGGKRVELLPCEMTLKGHKHVDGVCRNNGPTISIVQLESTDVLYGAALSVPIPECTAANQWLIQTPGMIFNLASNGSVVKKYTSTFNACGDSVVAFGITQMLKMHEMDTSDVNKQELWSSLLSSPLVIRSRVTFTIREVCLTEDHCYDLSEGPNVCIPCSTCPSGTTDGTNCRHDSGDYTRMGLGDCLVGDLLPRHKKITTNIDGCETNCTDYGDGCIGFDHVDDECYIYGHDTYFNQVLNTPATSGYITATSQEGNNVCYAKKYAPTAEASSTGWHTWEIVAAGGAVVLLLACAAAVYHTKTKTNLKTNPAYELIRM